jgi:putative hydrolase of the HAD superfamily
MGRNLTTIGFDADDTLWQNEQFFRITEARFAALLADHADPETISGHLLEVERRNLSFYGYGIKGFTLSMIETAVTLTGGKVPTRIIAEILSAGREMLTHPVEAMPHARETLEQLFDAYRLVLITKGDLFDQERKLAQSGLGEFFSAVEIVSEKTTDTYRTVFARHGEGAGKSMMVGNSLRSDVVPAIEAGGWGIHIPHELTWALEHSEAPSGSPRFRQLRDLGKLNALLMEID